MIGCLHLIGGQYGLMQAIAWGNMLVDYSAEKGLAQGIVETFDGNHPCELCSSIQKAKSEGSKSPDAPWGDSIGRLHLTKLIAGRCVVIKPPAAQELLWPSFVDPILAWSSSRGVPETPPPDYSRFLS